MSRTIHSLTVLTPEQARPSLRLEEYDKIDRNFAKPGFRGIDGSPNWHCTCVSSYITGPCGYFLRQFLENLPKFKDNSPEVQERNSKIFTECQINMLGCIQHFPRYYSRLMDTDVLNEIK